MLVLHTSNLIDMSAELSKLFVKFLMLQVATESVFLPKA